MRSFFLRIFLWFWLAVALAGVGSFLVVLGLLREDPAMGRWRGLSASGLAVFAEMAADAYAERGRQGLDHYLDRAEEYGRIRAYLFDRSGRELSGRIPSRKAADLARQLTRLPADRPRFSVRSLQAAYRVPSRSGRGTYILVAEIPGGLAGNLMVPLTRVMAVVLLAGLTCYGLARSFADPVSKLRNATRQIAAGDLSVRVGPAIGRRRDEIGELARDFDRMAERLESSIAAQRRLLGDISHELRSPLARQRVALELARQKVGADAGTTLDRIEREAERMNGLVGHLLTLTRLDSGDAPMRREPVDLVGLTEEVVADAGFEARRRDVRVSVSVPTAPLLVNGDPDLLRSAIENVVRNAVHYTASGTVVEVTLTITADHAALAVRDQGSGVPEEALANLFRPFYRVAEARDRDTGGAGLGLAITERAARLHAGSVRAANHRDGGLVVELTLPLVRE